MTRLSEHFTLEEMVRSEVALRRGLENSPSEYQVDNMKILCETVLEPARDLLWSPIHVNSGYRSPVVNQFVGGSKLSEHMDGRAADIIPVLFRLSDSLSDAFHRIRRSNLPYNQIILECGAWLHLSCAKAGVPPRRDALIGNKVGCRWTYTLLKREGS